MKLKEMSEMHDATLNELQSLKSEYRDVLSVKVSLNMNIASHASEHTITHGCQYSCMLFLVHSPEKLHLKYELRCVSAGEPIPYD